MLCFGIYSCYKIIKDNETTKIDEDGVKDVDFQAVAKIFFATLAIAIAGVPAFFYGIGCAFHSVLNPEEEEGRGLNYT
jgi:hypothetical protein